jgi:Pentapeptide repeats (8 copies)
MEASALPPDDAPEPLAPRFDVRPLLRSYSVAIELSREPPASLALPRRLQWIHRWLRPRWACHYFTTRYVRRRTDALERALAGRMALGRTDADDRMQVEALARFKASLAPAPSRAFTIAGILGAIALSQALVGAIFDQVDGPLGRAFFPLPTVKNTHAAIKKGFDSIGLTPDVKSIRDVVGDLVSANFADRALILLAIAATLYVFGRPLASGYRLSYLCLGRPDGGGRRRRASALWQSAAELETTARESAAVRAGRAQLRRDVPLDLVVKALPWLVVLYWFVGLARLDAHASPPELGAWLLVCVANVAILTWVGRRWRARLAPRRPWRIVVAVGCVAVPFGAFWAITGSLPTITDLMPTVEVLLAPLAIVRLGWLVRSAHARGYPTHWVALPIVLTCAVAVASPYDDVAIYRTFAASGARQWARESAGIVGVPRLSRHDLQLLVSTREILRSSDLRGQDLHGLSLRSRDLADAQLRLADLRRADLQGARLQGADLRGALASKARMRGAQLDGADLRCSDLRGADLTGASLRHANLEGAIRDHATRLPAGFKSRQRLASPGDVSLDPEYFRGDAATYGYVSSCLDSHS